MKKAHFLTMPPSTKQLRKWQLILLGLLDPSPKVLDILFPRGLPYTKLAKAVVRLALRAASRSTIHYLKNKGYVVSIRGTYELSSRGKRYSQALLAWYVDRNPKQWDGRWRIVVYDIPEERKIDRDHLRRLLLANGFKKLQASVWASPYAVPRELNEQLWNMRIKYHVLYLLVSEVDYDRTLRRSFPELS